MNKIYPLQMIKDVPFPKDRTLMEDGVWTPLVLEKCSHLIKLPFAKYHYTVEGDSLSHGYLTVRKREALGYFINVIEKDRILARNLTKDDRRTFAKNIIEDIQMIMLYIPELDKFNCFEQMKKLIVENSEEIVALPDKLSRSIHPFLQRARYRHQISLSSSRWERRS